MPFFILIFLLNRAPLYSYFNLYHYGALMFCIETLMFLYMLTFSGFRQLFKVRLNLVWVALVVFHLINYSMKVSDKPWGMVSVISSCAYLMLTTEYLMLTKPRQTLKWLIAGFLIFTFLAFNMVKVDANFDNRLKGEGMHPNQFAQTVGIGMLVLAYAKYYMKLKWRHVILLTLPGVVAILGCGSRNGLFLFFAYCVALLVAKEFNGNFDKGKLFRLALLFGVVYLIGSFFLENTMVGERMMATEEQTEISTGLQTGIPILDKMGDRGIFYYIGFMNFLDNPITGIGLYNFANYNSYPVPVHSEYMIHMAEGGLVGISLFLTFMVGVIRNLWANFKKRLSALSFINLLMIFAHLVVCITARCFDITAFYVLLGLCMATVISRKRKIKI